MKINALFPFDYSMSKQKNNKFSPVNISFGSAFKANAINTDIIEIFKDLAKIPSPPLNESKVANWILNFCKKNKIKAVFDNYKNIKINIPATDKTKKSLLISAHMDVIGDDSPVNIINKGGFIKTDGKRTLGADDKSGVAAALSLAKEFGNSNFKHGGLEILLTRDEELGMTGIMNVDFKNIKSKYILVLDEAKLGRFDNSGAGYTTVKLSLTTPYGGHSGMNIGDKYRLNAAKMISELISKVPQGVYRKDKNGVITSINVGTIIAGDIQNSAAEIAKKNLVSDNYLDFFMKNSVTNVINTKAMATLSIRSSSKKCEYKLRKLLVDIADKFNRKYKGLALAKVEFEELMPVFEKTKDVTMENIYKDACKSLNLKPSIGAFPAGAETHIYAKNKNKNNETFLPALLGVADIYDAHSSSERMNVMSLKKGYELVKQIFLKFNGA